jgi:hypothetical protein
MTVAASRPLPGWSRDRDAEHVAWFLTTVAPHLRDGVRPTDIRQTLGCHLSYAIKIKHALTIPHPRHFRALAELATIEYPFRDASDLECP